MENKKDSFDFVKKAFDNSNDYDTLSLLNILFFLIKSDTNIISSSRCCYIRKCILNMPEEADSSKSGSGYDTDDESYEFSDSDTSK